MRRTVAKIMHNGTYRVVFDDSTIYNPYSIYFEHHSNGFHSKKIATYQDFTSCMYHLTEQVVKR